MNVASECLLITHVVLIYHFDFDISADCTFDNPSRMDLQGCIGWICRVQKNHIKWRKNRHLTHIAPTGVNNNTHLPEPHSGSAIHRPLSLNAKINKDIEMDSFLKKISAHL